MPCADLHYIAVSVNVRNDQVLNKRCFPILVRDATRGCLTNPLVTILFPGMLPIPSCQVGRNVRADCI
jgi:hypothetical protein